MGEKPNIKFGKNEAVFIVALAGLVAEIVNSVAFNEDPNPTLLALFGGILGYPIVMAADVKRQGGEDDDAGTD